MIWVPSVWIQHRRCRRHLFGCSVEVPTNMVDALLPATRPGEFLLAYDASAVIWRPPQGHAASFGLRVFIPSLLLTLYLSCATARLLVLLRVHAKYVLCKEIFAIEGVLSLFAWAPLWAALAKPVIHLHMLLLNMSLPLVLRAELFAAAIDDKEAREKVL